MGLTIALGGDTMLGRIVAETMRELGADYPLEAVAHVFHSADLGVVNLECAITSREERWTGQPKAFYFRADEAAAAALARAGVGAVNLANNHALDFGRAGLEDTIAALSRVGVACFGAGRTLDEAFGAAIIRVRDVGVGLLGFTDHPHDFAATANAPGVAVLDIERDRARSLARMTEAIATARARGAELIIVSAHWGPNYDDEPEPELVWFARGLVDSGADLVFGHSRHVFQGIEIYRGSPILYAAGDLVDDYYVGDQGNDHALMFTVTFDGTTARRIDLHPCFIEHCRVVPAPPAVSSAIRARITRLCQALGTTVRGGDEPRIAVGSNSSW